MIEQYVVVFQETRCKDSEIFWIEQIKMPFMRNLHIWQGSFYNAILNMSGNGIVAGTIHFPICSSIFQNGMN